MCCETHPLRDFLAARRGEPLPLAPADDRRCRCTELGKWPGQPCDRAATGEDVLCDWCRVTDHMAWYGQAARDPLAGEYYCQHAVPYNAPGGMGGAGPVSEIFQVRAASQLQDSTLADYRLDLTGEMTAEGVMKYVQRRYGV